MKVRPNIFAASLTDMRGYRHPTWDEITENEVFLLAFRPISFATTPFLVRKTTLVDPS